MCHSCLGSFCLRDAIELCILEQCTVVVVRFVAAVSKQIAAEEQLPVDDIKQRLVVLDAELKKLEQEGCQMEDRIRSSLYFRVY